MQGIGRWLECSGLPNELAPLLGDSAPVVRIHGGKYFLTEVRAAALVALQNQYRRTRRKWDLDPVSVRRAMLQEDAQTLAQEQLEKLSATQQETLGADVDRWLAESVNPPDDNHRVACRYYGVLLKLGAIQYETQEVNPETWLTDLQEQIHASQTVTPRPTPHVRFDGPHGPVGWLYRQSGQWVLDFDEGPLAREIRKLIESWIHAVPGGVPRIVFDAQGRPKRHPTGGFLTDGVVPPDTDSPIDYLRSVETFISAHHSCCLVT